MISVDCEIVASLPLKLKKVYPSPESLSGTIYKKTFQKTLLTVQPRLTLTFFLIAAER